MRHDKAEAILRIALKMQGSAEGLTLAEIGEIAGVGRRTAERMRDALARLFPQIEETNPGELPKRWRLPWGTLNRFIAFTAYDLIHLQNAARALHEANRPDAYEALLGIEAKLHALVRPDALRRIEPDLEALTLAEGLAMRPGARPKIDHEILNRLREAILAFRKVRIRYRTRGAGGIAWHKVCPYGLLYGNQPYLVAYSLNPKVADYRMFRLSNIVAVKVLNEWFRADANFSLGAYARRSFGVFQEEPFDVVWRFKPGAAADARAYLFHPDQSIEERRDGSLLVRFRAGGALEMAWHLYTWGDAVEVIEPKDFWDRVKRQGGLVPARSKRRSGAI